MPAILPTELRRILDKLGITLAELAHLCRVHPVTARRWSSTYVPDGPAAILIRLLAAGKVSVRTVERASHAPEPR
jgi:DNA-binding transcriptional regulator YiaG